MKIKNFNDVLALLLMVLVIPGLWVAIGLKFLDIPEVVTGATIPAFTMILTYYFRKKPPGEGENPS